MRRIILSFFLFLLLLLLLSMIFGFNKNFYLLEFSKYHPEKELKVEAKFVRYAGEVIPEYLMGKRDNLNIPGFKNFFNDREIKHMEDVKRIFFWVKILVASFLVFLFIFLKPNDLPSISLYSIIYLIIFTSFFFFFPFDKLFTYFHKALFTNNLWLLNPETDRLIVLLPEKFFIDAVRYIISFSFLFLILLFTISKLLKRRRNEKTLK